MPAGVCNAVLLPVVQEFNAQARQRFVWMFACHWTSHFRLLL